MFETLAATKRTIKVGDQFKLVRHDWMDTIIHGNTGTTVLKGRLRIGDIRAVSQVLTTKIAFRTESGSDSWLHWPKAQSFRPTANGFEIDLHDEGTFREAIGYEFVKA
jgi:hypothetical protein